MINVLLVGANGRMGTKVKEAATKEINIVPVDKGDGWRKENIDVVLDFSSPEAVKEICSFCKQNKTPLVSGVTGYSKKEQKMLFELSNVVPVFHSGNFSLGINVLLQVVEKVCQSLKDYDIEIIEIHHHSKKDCPSGTAKMIIEKIKENRQIEQRFRDQKFSGRTSKELGVHCVRGGTGVGKHSVLFMGEQETIEISHSAQDRKIFATGALAACKWIVNKGIGFYTMEDMLK